ncbi:hypothetical protein WG926_00420 [Tistrella sp. BH-R2-4]|uniref:Transposase n=1 Tax=Tistrella arctica TaxID=3133430 RepID=A0ABU9YD85_9PROT
MKRSRFSEEQIIGILKEQGGRRVDGGCVPPSWNLERDLLQVESQIWRIGGAGGQD